LTCQLDQRKIRIIKFSTDDYYRENVLGRIGVLDETVSETWEVQQNLAPLSAEENFENVGLIPSTSRTKRKKHESPKYSQI
jgi:hypothetical protein